MCNEFLKIITLTPHLVLIANNDHKSDIIKWQNIYGIFWKNLDFSVAIKLSFSILLSLDLQKTIYLPLILMLSRKLYSILQSA
jgi:hypothetical protein